MLVVDLVELLGFSLFHLAIDDVVTIALGNTTGYLLELE